MQLKPIPPGDPHGSSGPSGYRRSTSLELSRPESPESVDSGDNPPTTWSDLAFLESLLPPSVHEFCVSNLGLCLVALAQFFFACMNITVKYFLSVTEISVATLILVRMGITMLGCWAALLVRRETDLFFGPPEYRKILIIRGGSGCIGLFASYMSFRGLSVSDSISIQFLAPSVTLVLGYFALKESFQMKEVVAGLCCLVGTLFVSRPPFLFGNKVNGTQAPLDEGGSVIRPDDQNGNQGGSRMVAVGWSFVAVFAASAAYVSIRYIGTRASPLHSMLYFTYACLPFCIIATIFTSGPFVWVTTWASFILIILCGIFGFIAQMLLTTGLQREKAGRASIALYLLVFFTMLLELVFFQTIPSFLSLIGITIILTSAFLAARFTSASPVSHSDVEANEGSHDVHVHGAAYPQPGERGATTGYKSVPGTDEVDEDAIQFEELGNGDAVLPVTRGHLGVGPSVTRRRSSATTD